jgi:hypothetical protein
MKSSIAIVFVFSAILLPLLGACSSAAPTVTPGLSEQDVAATVDAAIQATSAAEASLSATVDAAVQATSAVSEAQVTSTIPPAPTEVPTAPPPLPAPTEAAPAPPPAQAPTPEPVDATTMSEEELAALIDAAVAEALAASEAASTTTSDATSDGTISADETVSIEIALDNADEALALAEYLITLYADVYGEYASETLALLLEIEEDLQTIAQASVEMSALLETGSEAATAAIAQLEAALVAMDANVAAVQAQAQGWLELLQVELENRSAAALTAQASEIASNRAEAIQSALSYAETVRAALADSYVSQGELAAIAQANANAMASLLAQGGPQLQSLTGSIEALTAQVARGQWPQAQLNLGALESSLPRLP